MTFSAIACMFAMLFASCEKEPSNNGGTGSTKAAKINITLEKYYNAAGSMSLKNWERGDKVGIFNADAAKPEPSEGAPIAFGAQSSLFTFAVKDVQNGDNLMAYYPASADVTCAKGAIKMQISETQDGTIPSPLYVGATKFSDAFSGSTMTMKPFWCVVYAKVQMGAYSIKKATITANGGENLAGEITINASDMSVTASKASVTVEFAEARDCRLSGITIPMTVAPVALSNGYTITYTTAEGATFDYKVEDAVTLDLGAKLDTDTANSDVTQLLVCGDNMIYLLDAELAVTSGYRNAILWEWDAKKYAGVVGLTANNMIRLDDAKPVDDNKKILATSSKGYSVLIDKATGDVLWYSNISTNAHSAALLPNNRIAVACSDNGDKVQVFDAGVSNVVKFSDPLSSAHGVVWNPATERLYAVGGSSLKIYSLQDWTTAAPKLKLEKTISTTGIVTGLHDMTLVDENTLLLAGNKAAFFNVTTEAFTSISTFQSSHSMKSLNYNSETKECWFTDPTVVEVPDLTWASHTIRYSSNMNTTYETKNFKIDDLNCYKVRVYNW